MIFVDSSVWIDFYNDVASPVVDWLDRALGREQIVVGDLVIADVLQGYRDERIAASVQAEMQRFPQVDVAGVDIAIQAARNCRLLRARGVTIRKTIDTLIATRCIVEGWSLLYRDRDYEPFVARLGLSAVLRTS